jgi:hypothetical protein
MRESVLKAKERQMESEMWKQPPSPISIASQKQTTWGVFVPSVKAMMAPLAWRAQLALFDLRVQPALLLTRVGTVTV